MFFQIDLYDHDCGTFYACAGGDLDDEIVTEAAPIIKYMKGWHLDKVKEYCAKKGWVVKLYHI